eukprot:1153051-Pelagomonas_calceolata.AAC.9
MEGGSTVSADLDLPDTRRIIEDPKEGFKPSASLSRSRQACQAPTNLKYNPACPAAVPLTRVLSFSTLQKNGDSSCVALPGRATSSSCLLNHASMPKVILNVSAPNSLYMARVASRVLRDPCVNDPDYEEGLRRAEMYLDEPSVREIMSIH